MLEGSQWLTLYLAMSVQLSILGLLPAWSVSKTVGHINRWCSGSPFHWGWSCTPTPAGRIDSNWSWISSIQIHYGTLPSRCYLCPVICVWRNRLVRYEGSLWFHSAYLVRLGQHQKMRQMAFMHWWAHRKRVYTSGVCKFYFLVKRMANNLLSRNSYVKIDTCYVLQKGEWNVATRQQLANQVKHPKLKKQQTPMQQSAGSGTINRSSW